MRRAARSSKASCRSMRTSTRSPCIRRFLPYLLFSLRVPIILYHSWYILLEFYLLYLLVTHFWSWGGFGRCFVLFCVYLSVLAWRRVFWVGWSICFYGVYLHFRFLGGHQRLYLCSVGGLFGFFVKITALYRGCCLSSPFRS